MDCDKWACLQISIRMTYVLYFYWKSFLKTCLIIFLYFSSILLVYRVTKRGGRKNVVRFWSDQSPLAASLSISRKKKSYHIFAFTTLCHKVSIMPSPVISGTPLLCRSNKPCTMSGVLCGACKKWCCTTTNVVHHGKTVSLPFTEPRQYMLILELLSI